MRRMRHLKPREIQGCQLALDASIATSLYDATSGGSLVAANGTVARWEDQSGSGYHVTQATGTKQPLRRVANRAGLDALQFDNTDDRMINASISVALPTTMFSFGQTSNTATASMDSYGSSQHVIYRGGGADQGGKFAAIAGGVSVHARIADDSLWGGLIGTFSSAGSTILRGQLTGSNATACVNALSGISVGNLRGNPNPLDASYAWGGYLTEISVWNIVLPISVQKRLNDSRSRKWRTDR